MVAAFMVGLDDEIFVINSAGTVIRMEVRGISSQGRDATGVRVMQLERGQTVAAVAPVLHRRRADRPVTRPPAAGSVPGHGLRPARPLLLGAPPKDLVPRRCPVAVFDGRRLAAVCRCHDERGQAIPLVVGVVAIAALLLLALVPLAHAAVDRAEARTAADLAALAGAAEGEGAARELAEANGGALVEYRADGQ